MEQKRLWSKNIVYSKLKKISYILVSQVLILYLLLFSHSPFSLVVMCFGEDGHIALESTPDGLNCKYDSDITSNDFSNSASITEMCSYTNNCGTCLDIPITVSKSDFTITTQKYFSQIDISKTAVVLFPIPKVDSRINNTFKQNSLFVNPIINSLQTTILIC